MPSEWLIFSDLDETRLNQNYLLKYGSGPDGRVDGWGPKLRKKFNYFTPDDVYESLVDSMVSSDSAWLDIGCGRHLFPSNSPLAARLSERAKVLVGVDPDPNVFDNPFIDEAYQASIQEFQSDKKFDLITMRMVAEHVTDPEQLFVKLDSLVEIGGRLVIYTPWKWSPIPVVTRIVPFQLHHLPKKVFWNVEERDTFPVAYRMNTRRELLKMTESHSWQENEYALIDDCRTTGKWLAAQWIELGLRRMLRAVRLPYPERCIIATYTKTQ